MTQKLLFISMLGEREHFNPELFTGLCSSGLERDWIVDWHGKLAAQSGLEMLSVDICRSSSRTPSGYQKRVAAHRLYVFELQHALFH